MKTTQKLLLVGTSIASLLISSCVAPYYDDGAGYSGPYYGNYGPYLGGYGTEIIVDGSRYRSHSGDHHLYGQGFGHAYGSHNYPSQGEAHENHSTGSHGSSSRGGWFGQRH
jgi:hypothetical protein